MAQKTPSEGQARRRTRLAPEAREAMILDAAIDYFAEHGFDAQTRELAAQIGVSQPLIYRYFPTKEALQERVYQRTFEDRWDPQWERDLADRSVPIRQRLSDFYLAYLNAIDDRAWIRIVMYSGLGGWELTAKYISEHIENLLRLLATELRAALELHAELETELVWHAQSSVIYYLVRKHIHGTHVPADKSALVESIVDMLIDSACARDARAGERPVRGASRSRRR